MRSTGVRAPGRWHHARMIITPISEDDARGPVAEFYGDDIDALGYVTPHTKALALNPEALGALEQLTRAISAGLGMRRYELATLAAAKACRSEHCRLAHGRKSLQFFDEEELVALARDHRNAGLPEVEVAIMDFAEKVSGDSAAMTEQDSRRLRELGLTDREIVDVALAAAVRNYYGRALHALAIEVDPRARDLDPALLEALTKGI